MEPDPNLPLARVNCDPPTGGHRDTPARAPAAVRRLIYDFRVSLGAGESEASSSASLAGATVHTALPVADMSRATAFFREKLGLVPDSETESTAFYQAREGQLALFLSSGQPSGQHTQIGWTVIDIEATVAGLRANGVLFDDYDYPDFKTVDGIATFGPNRFAWFRDSEGNVHSIAQFG